MKHDERIGRTSLNSGKCYPDEIPKGAPMTEAHPHWVWDHMPKQCEFLLIKGMSINCLDSFSPSRCKCDHLISPRCWDISSHSSAKSDAVLDRLVEMIDAHAENWDELCELQEFIRELRQQKEQPE